MALLSVLQWVTGNRPASPASAVVLERGNREITVAGVPLRRRKQFRDYQMRQIDPECIVVEPDGVYRAIRWVVRAVGVLLIAVCTLLLNGCTYVMANDLISSSYQFQFSWFFAWAIFAGGIVIGIRLARRPRRIRFDRMAKILQIPRRERALRRYPLADVLAVQMLREGDKYQSGDDTTSGEWISWYQLNLVLNDETLPRVHLNSVSNRDEVRRQGQLLASFLKVPLLEQFSNA